MRVDKAGNNLDIYQVPTRYNKWPVQTVKAVRKAMAGFKSIGDGWPHILTSEEGADIPGPRIVRKCRRGTTVMVGEGHTIGPFGVEFGKIVAVMFIPN